MASQYMVPTYPLKWFPPISFPLYYAVIQFYYHIIYGSLLKELSWVQLPNEPPNNNKEGEKMKLLFKVLVVLASVTLGYLACYYCWITPIIDSIKNWFSIN